MHFDEKGGKMARLALPPIDDVSSANILLCCLLSRLDMPVSLDALYDIAVGSDVINYFAFEESLDYLTAHQSFCLQTIDGERKATLTAKGRKTAADLRGYVPKAYRDKLVVCALRYFARRKIENEVKVEYLPLQTGYYVHVRCLDRSADLIDIKLYAPNLTQAKALGEGILKNPTNFYGKVLEAAFDNAEKTYDADDDTLSS